MFQKGSVQALIDKVAEAIFSPSNSCAERVSNLDLTHGHSLALSAIVTSARALQQQQAVDENARYVPWQQLVSWR